MGNRLKACIFWTPRVLGILFAGYISLFALDVFSAGYGFWETVAAFLIHMIPTGLILAALAVAWRWEWVGTVLFAGLGLAYAVMVWGHFDWILFISGPAFLAAGLFLLSWFLRPDRRGAG